MKKIAEKHRFFWKNSETLISVMVGLLLIIISLIANYFAGNFATVNASNYVTDIILDNIRVYNVNFIFTNGSVALFIFIIFLCLREPKYMPFILKSLALFILIRSIFIILTHIGPFPTQFPLEPNKFFEKMTFGGDLFFSGHTGIPFLLALIFWREKIIRYALIATSLLFGITVLMGHLHYSIDVFAAFFITYTIFHIAREFFKKDYALMQSV